MMIQHVYLYTVYRMCAIIIRFLGTVMGAAEIFVGWGQAYEGPS